jgi:hypothetical protein
MKEMRNAHIGRQEDKQLCRSMHKWDITIKVDLKKTG